MKKLFIVGNGFDIAHGLHTLYEDFRRFLCDRFQAEEENDMILAVPEADIGSKGDLIFDEAEVAEFLVKIISEAEPDGGFWSDLESSLGKLDYSEAFHLLPEELDEDGDLDNWKTVYNNEDMASTLMAVVPYIKDFFEEWVDEITLSGIVVKNRFKNIIEKSDLFLTFNYTQTLEQCYSVNKENICYIHGKQGQKIFFGHGNDRDYTDDYMSRYIGAENALGELDAFLRKDTNAAFNEHIDFFQNIDQTIREIYSIGFSYGDVDLIYIKEICKNLSDKAVWYLNDYDPSKLPDYQRKLRQCGFRGTFGTFSI